MAGPGWAWLSGCGTERPSRSLGEQGPVPPGSAPAAPTEESLDFCSNFQAVLHGCLVALGQIFSPSFTLMDCVCYKNGLPQGCGSTFLNRGMEFLLCVPLNLPAGADLRAPGPSTCGASPWTDICTPVFKTHPGQHCLSCSSRQSQWTTVGINQSLFPENSLKGTRTRGWNLTKQDSYCLRSITF